MKPELNVDIFQIVARNSEADDIAWVYINVANSLPDDTGAHSCVKLEIPVRLDAGTDLASSESEAIRKAKNLLSCAITGL